MTYLPGDEFQLDARLLDLGESVTISLRDHAPGDTLDIFPRYLERCDLALAEQSVEPLAWLDVLEHERFAANDTICYTPQAPGNYLARWTSAHYGVEYRYFAVIDPSYLIYRPAVWGWPVLFPATDGPEVHNAGIPFDWVLKSTDEGLAAQERLRRDQQRYGDGIVFGVNVSREAPATDSAILALREDIAMLRDKGLDVGQVGNLWYDGGLSHAKVQLARAAGFEVLDGYVPRATTCGLGAPYYPFYISDADYRQPSQSGPTPVVACVYDFVGSWHFHGPVGFHRPSAEGSWARAKYYIDLAAQEASLTARNSDEHNFITTLVNYESPLAWGTPSYEVVWDEERGHQFFADYLRLLAFEHPRRWPIVFARAIDYAQYFTAHYREMPRRIVSSITHDPEYDRWWTDEWHLRQLMPAGYVPIDQNLRVFRAARVMSDYNMPVSHEFINYNDNRSSCRFEYACPKPVHYYDYTAGEAWPDQPVETDLPDPEIAVTTRTTRDTWEITFEIAADVSFEDYLLAIWDIPREFRVGQVETNAHEFLWIENTDGHFRALVRFDLAPACRVTVRISLEWSA